MPVILAIALYMRAVTLKQIAMALAGALGLVLAIKYMGVLVLFASAAGDIFRQLPDLLRGGQFVLPRIDISSHFSITDAAFSRPADWITTDRLRSILVGIELFRAHPFIGAGLGSFIDSEVRTGDAPLVIHSTPIWLLAEMGLVGLFVLAAPVFRIFWTEIRRNTRDIPASLLVMIIGGFAVMSLAHEMLYQRTFWLLLGAALARPGVMSALASSAGRRSVGGFPQTSVPRQGNFGHLERNFAAAAEDLCTDLDHIHPQRS